MSQLNIDFQQVPHTQNQGLPNASGDSQHSSFLRTSTGERNTGEIPLSHTGALPRQKIKNARISYSGYLLKRSCRPYYPNELTITATTGSALINANEDTRELAKKTGDNNHACTTLELVASIFGCVLRLAAPLFRYFPEKFIFSRPSNASSQSPDAASNTKIKLLPNWESFKNKPTSNGLPSVKGPNDPIGIQGSTIRNVRAHNQNAHIENSLLDAHLKNSQDFGDFIPPPPDYHDPKDGHIWRSKYCVLEEGVLYFYCNSEDGHSIEAQEERDQTFPSYDNNNVECIPSSGVTKSSLNNDKKSDGYLEAEHLAKSPMPRSYLSSVPTAKDKTGRMHYTYSNNSTSVMWEKRVALDRVGSVLASEADFGKLSFELLEIDSNDDYAIGLCQKSTTTSKKFEMNMCKKSASPGDRLILRAASPDDMENWIFEIHRSLQTFINKIHSGKVVSARKESSRLSCKPIKEAVVPLGNKCKESLSSLTEALKPTIFSVEGKNMTKPKTEGKYIPLQRRGGKYIPPHKRKEEAEERINPTESPSTKVGCMNKSEYDNILHSNNEKIDLEPLSSLHHNDLDPIVGPSRRLGGCADPTLIEGSICDMMYIKKKSSVVGKVDSKPYGSFGGCQSSGKADQSNNIQWEVGAVSKCGLRSSNEDSYLISNDLLAETTIKDGSTSFFKSFQSHGIFAIFDGHCGNHTARFAAEKFPSILLDESMKDEFMAANGKHMSNEEKGHLLLQNTVARLDDEFCKISMANGRDWESGATALIAIVIGDTLFVAGLGDSNGVLCHSTSRDSNIEESGWMILNRVEDTQVINNSESNNSESNNNIDGQRGVNVKLKEVVNPHSPSRQDEKKRIEEAKGWVVTDPETEKISRVCGDLAVSRALGDREFKAAYNTCERESSSSVAMHDGSIAIKWGSEHLREDYRLFPEPSKDHHFIGDVISSIPEVNSFGLSKYNMDEFLVLACDGLWDVMTTVDAARLTRDLLFKRGFSAKASADYLVERAFTLGSQDNVTVIVIRFYGSEKSA